MPLAKLTNLVPLFLLGTLISTPASAQAWNLAFESADPTGDQAPFPSHHDLVAVRAFTNSTHVRIQFEQATFDDAAQRTGYQIAFRSPIAQHGIHCTMGRPNPIEMAAAQCSAYRTLPGQDAEPYVVSPLIEHEAGTTLVNITFSPEDAREHTGSFVEPTEAGLYVWVGVDGLIFQNAGQSDSLTLDGGFLMPNGTTEPVAPEAPPPANPQESPAPGLLAVVGLFLVIGMLRRR